MKRIVITLTIDGSGKGQVGSNYVKFRRLLTAVSLKRLLLILWHRHIQTTTCPPLLKRLPLFNENINI